MTIILFWSKKTKEVELPLPEYKSFELLRPPMNHDADKLFPSSTTSQKVAATAVERDDAVKTSGIAALRSSVRRTNRSEC